MININEFKWSVVASLAASLIIGSVFFLWDKIIPPVSVYYDIKL